MSYPVNLFPPFLWNLMISRGFALVEFQPGSGCGSKVQIKTHSTSTSTGPVPCSLKSTFGTDSSIASILSCKIYYSTICHLPMAHESYFKSKVPEKSDWVATSSGFFQNNPRLAPAKVHDGLDLEDFFFHSEIGPFHWLQVDFGRTVQVRRHNRTTRWQIFRC